MDVPNTVPETAAISPTLDKLILGINTELLSLKDEFPSEFRSPKTEVATSPVSKVNTATDFDTISSATKPITDPLVDSANISRLSSFADDDTQSVETIRASKIKPSFVVREMVTVPEAPVDSVKSLSVTEQMTTIVQAPESEIKGTQGVDAIAKAAALVTTAEAVTTGDDSKALVTSLSVMDEIEAMVNRTKQDLYVNTGFEVSNEMAKEELQELPAVLQAATDRVRSSSAGDQLQETVSNTDQIILEDVFFDAPKSMEAAAVQDTVRRAQDFPFEKSDEPFTVGAGQHDSLAQAQGSAGNVETEENTFAFGADIKTSSLSHVSLSGFIHSLSQL